MATRVGAPAVVGGMASGAVATATMTAVFWAAERGGLADRLPPKRMTEAVLGAVSLRPRRERALDAATLVAHLAYGVAWGGVFGLLRGRLGALVPPGGRGLFFGGLLWALGYAGWGPMFGLVPPPWRASAGWSLTLVAAHLVYGSTLEAIMMRPPRGT